MCALLQAAQALALALAPNQAVVPVLAAMKTPSDLEDGPGDGRTQAHTCTE